MVDGPVAPHVPGSTVSACPCAAGPESAGGVALTGFEEALTAIGAETVGVDVPASLVAVMATRTVPPTSAAVGV